MVFSNKNTAPIGPARTKVSDSEVELRRILRGAPQDLWLDTIRRTRSDAHNSLIYWMLNQPECDFAIAAHAFFRSDPALHIDNPKPLSLRPGPTNLFAVVLVNWDTGFFRTHNLKVEPVDAHPRILARLNDKISEIPRASLPFNIPTKLLNPEGGESAQVPPHLSPDDSAHLWPLYTDLGLRVPHTAPGLTRKVELAKGLLKKVGIGPK
jgi:hypothetical protein